MKINLQKLGEQAIESTVEQTKMRLSEDASSMVFQLFTKNVYSNPIGTVVREITSNCFDSHIEEGVDSPVVIRKSKDAEGHIHISFIDYGVGMSPDRVKNIYGVYFESTKRVDNTQIGGFGIGGKTPLAYKRSTGQGEGEYDNSFFVITRFNGIEYSYLIYEGAESPIISELHQEKTKERNGTEIRVPVLERDVENFAKEMVKQLYYFENVVFEGFEDTYAGTALTNEYQIVRGKTFLFRGDNYNSYMHVCLGRVAYPIDYDTLGLSEYDYNLPVALKLEVGDIGVTVSRESLDYSESTIKMLKKKLEAVKKEIVLLIGKQYKDIQTLEQYFAVKSRFGTLEFKNGSSIDASELIEQKDIDFSNFKYSFMKMPNDKQLFKFFFDAKMYGKKPSRSRYSSRNNEFTGGYETLRNDNSLYRIEGEFNRKIVKQAYLKDQHTTYYIIQKREIDIYKISEIADLFNVALDNVVDAKGKIVPFVQSLIEMQDEYFEIVRKNTEDYDKVDVPQDFVDSRKRDSGITPELRKISISIKFVNGYSRDRVMLSTLLDYKMPIFYGTQNESNELHRAARMYNLLFDEEGIVSHCDYNSKLITGRRYYNNDDSKASIMFIQIANANLKYMKHCKNAMPVSMFQTKMLYRKEETVMQYFQMRESIQKYSQLSRFFRKGYVDAVSPEWGAKVQEVAAFIENMPKAAKNDSLQYQRDNLARFFNLNDIEPTAEQQKILNKIQEIQELQEKNEKTLSYFHLPSEVEDIDDELVTLLQVALTL